jgi:2-oxoglutarate dehydrogenase E2 component (dihydrolipoamide succinyltransferase)
MAHEIKVPPFGESISESTVAQWLKKDGERVAKGENLVTIDTEKASSDLPADVSGILRIKVEAGTDVPIGAVIGENEEAAVEAPSAPREKPAPSPAEQQKQSAKAAKPVEETTKAKVAQEAPAPATPLAEPEAAAHTIGPATAEIPEATPLNTPTAESAPAQQTATTPATQAPGQINEEHNGAREVKRPMTRLRKTVAARLLQAKQQTAMLTTFAEVDMTEVIRLRQQFQNLFQKTHGIKLGFMSFFIKAAVDALKEMPAMNSRIEGDFIVEQHYYDISVAVSTDRGLVVPVIREADQKGFPEIEAEIAQLAARAREGKIGVEDMKGGTFTITNGGVFGSMLSTPLLNPPQVGILGMHAIEQRPMAVDGKVEIRPMMYLALYYDHRLIDGKEAVLFLTHVRDLIALPDRLLLGL